MRRSALHDCKGDRGDFRADVVTGQHEHVHEVVFEAGLFEGVSLMYAPANKM